MELSDFTYVSNEIKFSCADYKTLNIDKIKNAVLYLDPPYKNTKQYGKYKIDYEEFYDFCRRAAKNNFVFISEYWMPDDFEVIWQKEIKVSQRSDRKVADVVIEKLYTIKN